jgi:hypothetical protein
LPAIAEFKEISERSEITPLQRIFAEELVKHAIVKHDHTGHPHQGFKHGSMIPVMVSHLIENPVEPKGRTDEFPYVAHRKPLRNRRLRGRIAVSEKLDLAPISEKWKKILGEVGYAGA